MKLKKTFTTVMVFALLVASAGCGERSSGAETGEMSSMTVDREDIPGTV